MSGNVVNPEILCPSRDGLAYASAKQSTAAAVIPITSTLHLRREVPSSLSAVAEPRRSILCSFHYSKQTSECCCPRIKNSLKLPENGEKTGFPNLHF